MNKFKPLLSIAALASLFACTPIQPQKPTQKGYLKSEISQAELSNPTQYKRYSYACHNFETGETSYLASYFPLSRESRLKENFGFYFQLDGGKAQPFDHLENKPLNAKGTRFEVTYRAYHPIQGADVDLVARENSSIYYKTQHGIRTRWLECREG